MAGRGLPYGKGTCRMDQLAIGHQPSNRATDLRADTAMPSRARRFPNPFYVLLLVVSTAFVVTIFAYLIAPTVLDQAPGAAETSEIEVGRVLEQAPGASEAGRTGSLRLA